MTSPPRSAIAQAFSFPAEVWLVSIATFVNRSIGFLGLFAAVFFSSLRFSPTVVALALFVVGCAGMIGSVVGGRLASRFAPITVLIVGSAVNAPLLLGLVWAVDPVLVLVLASLSVGVSQSFLAPAATLVTESSYSGDVATAFAFYRIFINVGSIVAPAIIALLGGYRFSLLFGMSAVGSVLATVLLVAGNRLLRNTQKQDEASPTADTDAVGGPTRGNLIATWTVIVVFGIAIAIYAQHQAGIPLSVERLDGGARLYAILLLINPAIIIGCELPLNYLLKKVPWRFSYALGVAASGGGLAITGLGSSWTVCILGFVVFSLGEALFAPQASAAIARLSASGQNARYQGYLSAAQTAGIAVGPAIGAYAALNVRVPFWLAVAALSLLLAAAVLAAVPSKRTEPANHTDPAVPVP